MHWKLICTPLSFMCLFDPQTQDVNKSVKVTKQVARQSLNLTKSTTDTRWNKNRTHARQECGMCVYLQVCITTDPRDSCNMHISNHIAVIRGLYHL